MTLPSVLASVIRTLVTEFPTLRQLDLKEDTPLYSAGLLDSFATVTLLASLEKEFDVDLNVEKLSLEQLETPRSLAELCISAWSLSHGGRHDH